MIKLKGTIEIHNNRVYENELKDSVESLPDGRYKYIFVDDKKNPVLPQLKYLFGVVLKTISDALPSHPPVDALYRYFEELYAPLHTCEIQGETFEYLDLKNENSIEMNNVISDIIHHAASQWGIMIQNRGAISLPEAKELYMDAYLEMWKSPLNTNNIIHKKDE